MRAKAVLPAALLAPFVLLGGCGGPSAQEKAAADARAVAQVEAAQKIRPPVQPVAPDRIPREEITAAGLTGSGCRFRLEAERDEPIAVLGREKGAIRIAGRITVIAADSGSAALSTTAYEKYTGRTHALQVTKGPGEGEVASGGRRWPGSLTIRDPYERVVYFTPGFVVCG